eukprot:1190650-Rhodomonas_salina.1
MCADVPGLRCSFDHGQMALTQRRWGSNSVDGSHLALKQYLEGGWYAAVARHYRSVYHVVACGNADAVMKREREGAEEEEERERERMRERERERDTQRQ